MKPFFTEKDFDGYLRDAKMIADIANSILQEHGTVVYQYDAGEWSISPSKLVYGKTWEPFHKALLINTEEINKCAHKPKECGNGFICKFCSKTMEPNGWTIYE